MTSLMFKKIKNSNTRSNTVKEYLRRTSIVACIKHGMCPECGSNTELRIPPMEECYMIYCTHTKCRFSKKPFKKTYG